MSDTVGNLDDVEDVLSSIRRLVSETSEATKLPTDTAPKRPDPAVKPAQPALVLTSDQRIDQPAKSPKTETEAEIGQDLPVEAAVEQAMETAADEFEQVDVADADGAKPVMLDSLRKAVSGAFEEEQRAFLSEPGVDAEAAEDDTDRSKADRADAVTAVWPVRPPEDYYEDETDKEPAQVDDWRADGESDEAPQTDETAKVAEDEAADDDEAEAWFDPALDPAAETAKAPHSTAQIHHFDPQMTVVETGWTDEGEIIDASEIVAVDPATEDEMEYEDADLQDAEADDADADGPPGIEAFLEGDPTETVVENGIPDAEIASDDDETADDAADETAPREDAQSESEASMFASGYDADADSEDAISTEALADLEDATVIDEEALRDMVSEIVRQELTGEMGERITRNVRKLVRREIHRALMTREFD